MRTANQCLILPVSSQISTLPHSGVVMYYTKGCNSIAMFVSYEDDNLMLL